MKRLTVRMPLPPGMMWTQRAAEALVGQHATVSVGLLGGMTATGEVLACQLVVEDNPFDVPATYLLVTVEEP